MQELTRLAAPPTAEQEQALAHLRLLQPYLAGQLPLSAIARAEHIPLRTLQRWETRYRQQGLQGLRRTRRADQGRRRMASELQQLIEGLALQKTRPSAAAIHRQVAQIAAAQGWKVPSYRTVYAIVQSLDPRMVLLAHAGRQAYQHAYDLVYRREASRPNAIWQADHTRLNLWLLDAQGQPARPWLTVIEDDYSRCIASYALTFSPPTSLHTALALRQAIWRKADARWRICGIPDAFYTDHGSDFTSHHLAQVCADLQSQLVFSTPGMPRGRGRIERFFQTVDQLLLQRLPGFAPAGKPVTAPTLTLAAFEHLFLEFLVGEYHVRQPRDLPMPPLRRWEADGFLPRLPDALEELDLLLLTLAKTRQVRRDGIHFQGLRYLDATLAAFVGETVVIRYDPRDLAEIRVYHQDHFLCRAVCQELAGATVSLKEIVQARQRRRRDLQQVIRDRAELVQRYLQVHQNQPELPLATADLPVPQVPKPSPPGLKLYANG